MVETFLVPFFIVFAGEWCETDLDTRWQLLLLLRQSGLQTGNAELCVKQVAQRFSSSLMYLASAITGQHLQPSK